MDVCVYVSLLENNASTSCRAEEQPSVFNRLCSFHPSLSSLYIKRSAPKGPIRAAKELY